MENHHPNNDVEDTQLKGAQHDAPMTESEGAPSDSVVGSSAPVDSDIAGAEADVEESAENVTGPTQEVSEELESPAEAGPVEKTPAKKRRSPKKAVPKAEESVGSESLVPEGLEKLWYVLKVQSNRERTIRDSIIRRVKMEGMGDFFGEIFIPTEKVVETKGGGRRVRENKLLPGYMMIEMVMTDESWHLVRSTSGVGDFTGAAGKPIPMEDHEVRRWRGLEVQQTKEEEKAPRPVVKFDVAVGDQVKVKEGAFAEFEGLIDQLDQATGKVKVIIEIFGRPTEVELEHWQVEKA